MSGWELPALAVVAMVLVGVGIWRLVASWGRRRAEAATVTDDLKEAHGSLEAIDRAREAKRNAPTSPRALSGWLRGLHKPGGGEPKP